MKRLIAQYKIEEKYASKVNIRHYLFDSIAKEMSNHYEVEEKIDKEFGEDFLTTYIQLFVLKPSELRELRDLIIYDKNNYPSPIFEKIINILTFEKINGKRFGNIEGSSYL